MVRYRVTKLCLFYSCLSNKLYRISNIEQAYLFSLSNKPIKSLIEQATNCLIEQARQGNIEQVIEQDFIEQAVLQGLSNKGLSSKGLSSKAFYRTRNLL